jgi:solute carrier family 13 (sodium-dependent dicarboxylate transporter), member 2/3/5
VQSGQKMNKNIKLIISIGIPVLILLLPSSWIPIQSLSIVEHRLIAIFALASLFWIFEPIPIYATSLLIIFLELVMVSDKGLYLFRSSNENLGQLLSYKSIMATFASPIILLFLGGFFLAMAATKYRLDINLARVLLKPFGKNPKFVMLGLMIITAIFSMFMSNTATTAMMLALLTPILSVFQDGDRGKIAFVLAVPVAANIGGIGTPIGTPPNAIALKYLTGDITIGFGQWMAFAVPFAVVLLLLGWILLIKFFPAKTPEIKLEIKGKFLKNWKALTVYFTFGITLLLWLVDFLHGMNSYIVALIPVVVFSVTGIINKEDLRLISWDVLWLVAGGIALGMGLEESGLSVHLIESIPFGTFSPYFIVLLATILTLLMANFMSHTATANLLLPIMAALGTSIISLVPLGGAMMLILSVTMASSIAMVLPISTPPNALAHATGLIETKHMAKIGIIIGVVGLFGIYLLMYILKMVDFL